MKKGIYLTIITIVTVICIIGGSLYHFANFLSFLPFSSKNTTSTELVDSADTQELDGFDNIWADVDVSDIIITRGENYAIDYKATENTAPKYEVKNGTLTIKQTVKHYRSGGFGTHNRSCTITITVPKDATLASIDLDTSVGDILLDSIIADKLVTDSSVGDTEIRQCTIDSIETDSSVGDTKISGCTFLDLDTDSDIGDIIVKSATDLSDYEIELDTNIGDVTVNGHNYKRNFSKTGSSGCSITLDNSTGDISLSY